ncbi:MAG TPA: porin [Telluria sp.]|nr:porin [Telluria sp.]
MVLVHSKVFRFTALLLAAWAGPAAAQDADSPFKFSGFASIVAGRLTANQLEPDYAGPDTIDGVRCPCYIADWGNAGVYDHNWSLKPESRLGVQMKYAIAPAWNAVAQVVVRGSDSTPNLQWAYLSYSPSREVEIQLGRKRIPLYYYSDFQDIGMSYPWVTPPPELYGWEATNYNGASVRWRTQAGDTNVTASVMAGKETVNDSLYQRLYYDSKTKVVWGRLLGADLELAHGPLTVRGVYVQARVHTSNPLEDLDDYADLQAYGIAANLDFEDWFVLSEVTQLKRQFDAGYWVKAPAYTIGAGYHYGNWTPFLNYARYREKTDHLDLYAPQSFSRTSLTLRYDVDPKSALKFQVDRERDDTNNFGGNTNIIRISYDRLF